MLLLLFKLSRALHKYSGLIFFFYFLLMAISGVLLNHPELIHKVSVPLQLTPTSHTLVDGNRMAVRETIVDGDNIYLAGKAGVWWSNDNGLNFFKIDAGFPSTSYDQDTFSLSLDKKYNRLFAGTRNGLYVYSFADAQWQNIPFGATSNEPVIELLQIKNRLLLFTQQHCYSSLLETQEPFFLVEPLSFDEKSRPQSARLLHFFLKIHDGSIFGLGGRLLVDVIGLALIFLCVTGLIIWLLPRRKKKSSRPSDSKFKFQWFYSHHLKIGAYAIIFISIIVLSGIVIRPPFVKTVAAYNVPLWTLPMENGNNWKPRIDKAVFEPETETLWVATRQGFFRGRPDFTQPLQKQAVPVPRSGMGTRIFESLPGQQLLIGSFSGLYVWDPLNHRTQSLVHHKNRGNTAGNRYKATAVIIKKGIPIQVADYHHGLVPLTAKNRLHLPPQMAMTPMSLWHFLFEFHNGRIFQQWLGTYTWMLIPLGGFLLLSNLITGLYDWLWRNRKVIFKKKQTVEKLNHSAIKEL